MPYILSVSIVLYKTPIEHIRQILASLERTTLSIYLYIVDNSPQNMLLSEISTELPFEYIHIPSNPGFGTAHNVAIRKSQMMGSKYHLVVNADIKFNSDVLTPMLAHMDMHPEVGQMMPKVLNLDGSVQRLCKLVPTPSDLLLRRFFSCKRSDANNRHFELHDSGYKKIMFVPYLSGCFMLFRQSSLQEIGLFDERFFMYPEDIDLTRRMAEHYETIFYPNVSLFHKHRAASKKSLRMLLIHVINLCKYFNKWGWFLDPMRQKLNKKTLDQFANLK